MHLNRQRILLSENQLFRIQWYSILGGLTYLYNMAYLIFPVPCRVLPLEIRPAIETCIHCSLSEMYLTELAVDANTAMAHVAQVPNSSHRLPSP